MSHLSELFRSARAKAGLSVHDAAGRTGLKNVNKQVRVLQALEGGGDLFPKAILVERFARVLSIDLADIVQAMSLDYAEYEAWCEEPIQPYLIIRAVPGFYLQRSLPQGCTIEEGSEAAWKIVRETHLSVAMKYKRGRAIYFEPDGKSFHDDAPVAQIGDTGRQRMAELKRIAQIPKEMPA